MHQNQKLVEARIERALNERITPACYSSTAAVELRAWQAPGEPVPADEALRADYEPFAVGRPWGSPWSTWWFEVRGTIPDEWAGRTVELLLDPGFVGDWPGNQAECLVHTAAGVPVKGIHPRNSYLRLAESAAGGEPIHYYVEAAANPDILANGFVPTLLGDRATAPDEPLYRFRSAQLAVFEPEVWGLRFDVEVLFQLLAELPDTEPRRHEVLRALERCLDRLALDDIVGTAAEARAELAEMLARPAAPSAHRLSAVGHAHIDSAWLWPIRETKRKTARTFSNVLALAEQYPDFRFACSQAQQYAWVKERYPAVWRGIKRAVAAGSWIPVGSMWVEPDGNLPGGEAMVRQLTHGIRFFADELGVATRGVWMPDSFGYSAAFPQLARLAGLDWFLTQKISWNQSNAFPHHTFWWEGIDGSRIFTHFPPIDTYNSTLEAAELHHAVRQFREKGRATTSLVPFGYGDGGGGPTREMMERQRRVADLEGSPRVVVEHPDDFFARARAEYPDAPVWVGELYLELHRGTFTSHAREKRGNRLAEHLLREAELWWTVAALETGADYPYDALDRLWKQTLLQQFHDILPGSSISWVHRENEEDYARNRGELEALIDAALARVAEAGSVVNVAGHPRRGVVDDDQGAARALVEIAGSSVAPLIAIAPSHPVTVAAGPVAACTIAAGTLADTAPGGFTVENGLVRIAVDTRGLVVSVVDLRAERELIPDGRAANLLQLHEDVPNAWDAWDIDAHYRRSRRDLDTAQSVELVESSPLRALIRVRREVGRSRIEQFIRIDAEDPQVHFRTERDWREDEKLLKVSFPLVVHAQHHSAEIPFGHLRRPTHTNTAWDDARFEVVAHRFIHVEEPGYGVGLVNAGSYGHDVARTVGPSGEVETEVRISLVRAARSPDPVQDLGEHRFDYALVPGATIAEIVRRGYEQNLPLRVVGTASSTASTTASTSYPPLISLDGEAIVLETVKLADDRSGDLVLRLYEATGGRSSTTIGIRGGFSAASPVDLLECPLGPELPRPLRFEVDGESLGVTLRPFQVLTVRLRRPVATAGG